MPKRFGYQPVIEVYLALNDPHSYMLIQALAELEQRFTIKFCLFLVYESRVSVSVEPKIWRQWAINDANVIAQQYGFTTINVIPSANALFTGQQLWQMECKDIKSAVNVFHQTWKNNFERYYNVSTPVINFQIKNQQRLYAKGHYSPASLCFLGEWFVGVDRLSHIETKLAALGFSKNIASNRRYNANMLIFKQGENQQRKTNSPPIEMFLSLRSPYSFIGFYKIKKLCEYYQVPLVLKPILPLVMRNVPVPKRKKKYIYTDAHREAVDGGIPYCSFVDPIGQGVIKCFQLFAYAQAQGKSLAFIQAVFDAIYINNIDVAITNNLINLCKAIELDYQAALEYGLANDWQQWSDENQMALDKLGFWGVPCFRYGDVAYWGQDRLAEIEKAVIAHFTEN
ncbi:DsbA family protein [Thalassotalea piscium]|uniref:2-hydroxychromene-2-carboxylate isomerase n=1 Tax=Thalassotalea piscium TaxID=1230533 RepID=A0A7X0TTW7_9GAMM|nr:DsbA family protein [Thalassotalea piscium]MBB6543707.1 2-hydroxychromene-2-carboxylate isomerase [Thalassotalea piscium]